MTRVLLIDDDPSLLDVLALAFEDAGYEVSVAADGVHGIAAIREQRPALVVCDVNLPGLDGFTLCRRLRAQGDATPFIMLTSRDHEVDEAIGLELGADDYITKPFSTRVLLARTSAVLRRHGATTSSDGQPPVVVGSLTLDPDRFEVRWAGTPLKVTVTEFRLMEALARRPGVVFSREQLLRVTRGDDSIVVERIIDTYIRRLRRLFESIDPGFDRIETVVGLGYRWKDHGGA